MGTKDEKKAQELGRAWAQRLDERYSEKREVVMLQMAIDSFLEHCRAADLAVQTVRNYRLRLMQFCGYVGDQDVSLWSPDDAFDLIAGYLNHRQHEISSTKHDRVPIGTFMNYLRSRRWYRGENPCDAKLHMLRRPRRRLKKTDRCTTVDEDLVLRRESQKSPLWPMILLTRWAGLRRGEACTLKWDEIDLDSGCLDVSGHEGGRKHPRRVWLARWVVLQLRALRPSGWLPENGRWPVWPHHADTATELMEQFCIDHAMRRITFNDLRASFATECYVRGLTPAQESRIVGHGVQVAERHYVEYEARDVREKLPPDPLTEIGPEDNTSEAAKPASGQ